VVSLGQALPSMQAVGAACPIRSGTPRRSGIYHTSCSDPSLGSALRILATLTVRACIG
jgi:hypothetical protein